MPKGYEVERIAVRDGAQLLKTLKKATRLVALDERGKDLTSVEFAKLLNEETAFAIGGPDGLPEELRKRANVLLRLSSMTLPHALAQVVLMEQLYRAATLLTGHPYHRA
jgi:23S rRNA (pseudouridine1915-N3)-methyltransferase